MLALIFAGGGAGIAPVADFIGTPLSGATPLSVAFTDLSTNSPTSWAWNFGDGNTSVLQNPTNIYGVAGSYTVSLTATNAIGSDTMTKPAYITVGIPSKIHAPWDNADANHEVSWSKDANAFTWSVEPRNYGWSFDES